MNCCVSVMATLRAGRSFHSEVSKSFLQFLGCLRKFDRVPSPCCVEDFWLMTHSPFRECFLGGPGIHLMTLEFISYQSKKCNPLSIPVRVVKILPSVPIMLISNHRIHKSHLNRSE